MSAAKQRVEAPNFNGGCDPDITLVAAISQIELAHSLILIVPNNAIKHAESAKITDWMADHAESVEAYRKIPSRIKEASCKQLGMQELAESPEPFLESFLRATVSQRTIDQGLLGQLRVQTILLDPPTRPPKTSDSQQPPRRLSARQKKALKLYQIPKDKQEFERYLPLHQLWKSYMGDLLQLSSDGKSRNVNQSQLNQKVMKADYHGSMLTVSRSKCPSYIGTCGIVLQETQNTVKLICRDNRIKTIPKAHSIFTFDLYGYQFSLYGNHMRFRSSERSARKFKDKPTIDL